jgi:endoglucanase
MKILIIGLALFSFVSCKQTVKENCMNPSGFLIKRGVNLSHWLSQDFGWEPKYAYINENDIRFIDSIGYDHVRIPIDEKEMWKNDGEPNVEAFNYLTSCLEWCAKYKLRAIVDMHIVKAHYFNAENEGEGDKNTLWIDTLAQQNFINLWIQLSAKLHKYPNAMVAYEILNEAVAPNNDDWNKLMNKTVAVIRKLEPQRVIIIGANMWQIAPNLKYLKLPEVDKNIILSFHTYTPLAFTHHKADWLPLKSYVGPVHYPGQIITNEDYKKYMDTTDAAVVDQAANAREIFNKQRLMAEFKTGLEFAKAKNLQLYCGEFGCLPTVERKERLQFYTDLLSAFKENNIAWCNWEYKGDFGIYFFDRDKKKSHQPDFELIHILLQDSIRL